LRKSVESRELCHQKESIGKDGRLKIKLKLTQFEIDVFQQLSDQAADEGLAFLYLL